MTPATNLYDKSLTLEGFNFKIVALCFKASDREKLMILPEEIHTISVGNIINFRHHGT